MTKTKDTIEEVLTNERLDYFGEIYTSSASIYMKMSFLQFISRNRCEYIRTYGVWLRYTGPASAW